MPSVIQYSKREKVPFGDGGEALNYRYEFKDIVIKGTQFGTNWWYDAKVDGKKYQKLYLDIKSGILYGRKNELSFWETVSHLTTELVDL